MHQIELVWRVDNLRGGKSRSIVYDDPQHLTPKNPVGHVGWTRRNSQHCGMRTREMGSWIALLGTVNLRTPPPHIVTVLKVWKPADVTPTKIKNEPVNIHYELTQSIRRPFNLLLEYFVAGIEIL